MKHIKFTIPIAPRGQMRARSRSVARNGSHIAMTYKAGKQRKEEVKLAALMYPHRPEQPFDGQIILGVKAFFEIPKSKPRKFVDAATSGEIRPIVKPDLSNIIKMLEDVCNGVFWVDDKTIVGYMPGTGKYYATPGTPPRWEIELLVRD